MTELFALLVALLETLLVTPPCALCGFRPPQTQSAFEHQRHHSNPNVKWFRTMVALDRVKVTLDVL